MPKPDMDTFKATASDAVGGYKTYFLLNDTHVASRVIANTILTLGDLVLLDRSNEEATYQSALLQVGATPVYLDTAGNPYGITGGIEAHCLEERYVRGLIGEVAPDKAGLARPFRLAIIQLGTYDGTVCNARQVVDRIGSWCDYILFDCTWVNHEQLVSMLQECSPLLLDLVEKDPGIFVTQRAPGQQAGVAQASQLHKKDLHIQGQPRFCSHARLRIGLMAEACFSRFYPLFASMDVEPAVHAGRSDLQPWDGRVKSAIDARKRVRQACALIRPFVLEMVDGRPWQAHSTDTIASDSRFFELHPEDLWHGFQGYADKQYFLDPCRLVLITPGINRADGSYTVNGIPACILGHFLRQTGIAPHRCHLNATVFLLSAHEDWPDMDHLVAQLARFERFIQDDAPLNRVLPAIYEQHEERYCGYSIRRLCQEMHNLYRSHALQQRQMHLLRKAHFPVRALSPHAAHREFIRGNAELVPLADAQGRIAGECAFPSPPGVLCLVPGEVWGGAAFHYLQALEDVINRLPGFAPELRGLYLRQVGGGIRAFVYVLKA